MHLEPRPLTLAHHVRAVELGSTLIEADDALLQLQQSPRQVKTDEPRNSCYQTGHEWALSKNGTMRAAEMVIAGRTKREQSTSKSP